jgi:hypothetical protein
MQAVMRACLPQKWQRKLKSTTTVVRIQDDKQMPRLDLPRGSPLDQKQCLLFGKLSAEVRLLIYKEVLADPQRLLHFLHFTYTIGRPAKLGHWRCADVHSPLVTWQHVCFGVWIEGNAQHIRHACHTNSDLISLLLACSLMSVLLAYTALRLLTQFVAFARRSKSCIRRTSSVLEALEAYPVSRIWYLPFAGTCSGKYTYRRHS